MGKFKILLLVIAAGLLAFLTWYFLKGNDDGLDIESVQVVRGDIEVTVISNGIVQPQNRLEIKPPIGGRLETILVKEGDVVQKGQILAWMSSTERAALLDAARAKGSQELAHWETLFKPTPLIAPLSGMLIVRNVEPGQVVTSQDPVLVMSDHLIIRVQVDETDIAQIKLGQPAVIRLEAYPEEVIPGKVDKVSFESVVVNNVTVYEVDVAPQTVPDFMRAGMSAEVKFRVEFKENTLLIPATAVRRAEKKRFVTLPDSIDPKVYYEKEINLGLRDGKYVEVLTGLIEGETILIPKYRRSSGSSLQRGGNPLNPMPRGRIRR